MRKEMIALSIVTIVLSFVFLCDSCKKHENEQQPIEIVDTISDIDTMSLPNLNLDSVDFTIKTN